MMKIWDKIDGVKNSKSIMAWLFQIANNSVYNFFRRKKARNTNDDKIIDAKTNEIKYNIEEKLHNYESNLIAISEKRKMLKHNKLKTIIDNLNPRYKEVYILRFEHGMQPNNIAKKLKLKINTVYNCIERARKKVKSKIEMEQI